MPEQRTTTDAFGAHTYNVYQVFRCRGCCSKIEAEEKPSPSECCGADCDFAGERFEQTGFEPAQGRSVPESLKPFVRGAARPASSPAK